MNKSLLGPDRQVTARPDRKAPGWVGLNRENEISGVLIGQQLLGLSLISLRNAAVDP